ncbi:MAG: HAD family hydrolase [Patescibacteria group bacterium]
MKILPKLNRAVFFDRDGVLNKKPSEHDYVKNFDEFFWNQGAQELIKKINDLGFKVIVVSNQRGVARGKMTADFVEKLHIRMNYDLAKTSAHIDAFYYCPHDLADKCMCRKPASGMFLYAAKELGIDLENSFAIGDNDSDTIAAVAAGCRSIKITTDTLQIEKILSTLNL